MFLVVEAWHKPGLFTGGIGHISGARTNIRFAVLGTGAGQISLKAESFTAWRLQYIFDDGNLAFT